MSGRMPQVRTAGPTDVWVGLDDALAGVGAVLDRAERFSRDGHEVEALGAVLIAQAGVAHLVDELRVHGGDRRRCDGAEAVGVGA